MAVATDSYPYSDLLSSNNFAAELLWMDILVGVDVCWWLGVGMILSGVFVASVLLFTNRKAPYGRYATKDQLFLRQYDVLLPVKVCWLVQEAPAFLIPFYLLFVEGHLSSMHTPNCIVLLLFLIHYFQRAFVYPFLIKNGKQSPVSTFGCALLFCVWNGYLQGCHHVFDASYPPNHLYSFSSILGIVMFFSGLVINIHSDSILRSLRENGSTGYKMPAGGLFEYVSCANYLGECVEWVGWGMLAGSVPAFSFAFFTLSNLGPRALTHHRFYVEKFEDYPKNRKALIPFLL